jgi:hypothetical protein
MDLLDEEQKQSKWYERFRNEVKGQFDAVQWGQRNWEEVARMTHYYAGVYGLANRKITADEEWRVVQEGTGLTTNEIAEIIDKLPKFPGGIPGRDGLKASPDVLSSPAGGEPAGR